MPHHEQNEEGFPLRLTVSRMRDTEILRVVLVELIQTTDRPP